MPVLMVQAGLSLAETPTSQHVLHVLGLPVARATPLQWRSPGHRTWAPFFLKDCLGIRPGAEQELSSCWMRERTDAQKHSDTTGQQKPS